MKNENIHCGECCWFKFETTDGTGCCIRDWPDLMPYCDDKCKNGKFTSKKEMRHHMAVLLQYHMADEDMNHRFPGGEALDDAIVFAYDYMKTFSKL